ncbi:MAG: hypothetical protein EAX89_13875, partial [Candidatus Lokiarchaeota archaeon]|nr:hypothetical protein [Candidatus Lokiarchaeota archaeon]
IATLSTAESLLQTSGSVWLNLTYLHERLNVSDTYNKTFFIAVQRINDFGEWEFENQADGDDTIVWDSITGNTPVSRDQLLKVDLSPLDETPRPSDVNLLVNGTTVNDIDSNNQGYYYSNQEFSGYGDNIDFEVNADWWEVSCDVTNVQLNFTKSDILAYSEFTIPTSGQDVRWNVTNIGGLNYFDSRITDFNTINYTIPRIWNDGSIRVFNGATEKTSNINKRLIDNKYREIQVLNAGNGTFWYLNATSSNLLTSIDTFVGGIPLNQVNFSNTVKFNSTFSEIIYDGTLNLSVFSPIPRYLNHTQIVDISLISSNDEFDVSDWNIYEDVKNYGIFKIQMSWNNDTAAGFLEDYITIIADTELILSLPKNTFNSSETFDLSVFFNDTGQDLGIDADTIIYQIGTGSVRTDNITPLGNGYYNITIDCNDTDFAGYGIKSIEVNTSKYFYNNQTESISFSIIGNTELIILYPLPLSSFDSGDTFNITLFYNDTVKNVGIDGAIIEYQLNSSLSFKSASYDNYAPGYYNITLIAADSDFNGYGIEDLIFNASKQYYHNQSESLSIRILGETSLTALKVPSRITYNASETVIIRLYFNDTVKNIPVDGATVSYEIGSAGLRTDNIDPFSLGPGYYDISIDCNDTDFNFYGVKSISIFINLGNYHNKSQVIVIQIFGETSLSLEKVPDQAYYDSSESMVLSLYFNDTVKNLGIIGGTLTYRIESGPIRSDNLVDLLNGFYEITIDCNDTDFNGYGSKYITVFLDKTFYHNQTTQTYLIVVGYTVLRILSPNNLTAYYSGQTYNITIEYFDTIKNAGITGATISYLLPLSGSPRFDNIIEIGNGIYRIEVSVNDGDFDTFGYVEIDIYANQDFYLNRSNTFTFHRQITTTISPSNFPDLGSVLRGLNISYMFNYSDTDDSAILNANWSLIGLSYGFLFYLQENGNGNYTFHFNTTFADVSLSPFTLFFNISAYGKQTQILQINIDVLIIYTDIVNPDWDDIIARNAKINQTFTFYFNNTVTNEPVKDLISSDIIVRNEGTSSVWNTGDFNWELINPLNDGNYILRISLKGLDSGRYYLSVNVSKFPNYNYSIFFFSFYLRGNFTEINIDYFSDVGGQGVLQPTGQNYSIYIERNLYVNFTIIDLEFGNRLITGAGTSVLIQYFEIGNLSNNGTLGHTIVYDANTYSYKGNILTSAFSITSNYIINITIFRINYENSTHSINLTLKAKHTTNITVLIQPSEVTAGDSFVIHFQVAYLNGSIWIPLTGTQITLTPYFDGIASTPILGSTNSTGGISIEITIRRDAENMSLLVQLASGYYYTSYEFTITDIEVIPFNPGFRFEDILPYIIIIGAAVAVAGGSVGVYRGVVVPKKREKQRILSEVKTIFDDAINLEHILVLYKATGTCIFFKSYGSEQIDPELIGGFLTAVSSFGKEMVAQEALNEISYGDKMLLLADGEFIRVALVLGKKASLILRQHLKEFIDKFEKVYNEVLPNWRGQLNYFRNAGEIVDDIFNTSIILPHQITYDFSNVKDLKNPHSKDILKIAHSCCEETEREFFFIATLLKDASEKTNKDTAEIFMGVKELRDKRILIPIEISAIEPQAISQQEMNLIGQKVSGLSNLTAEEKQKLVADLAQMGPMQREAYLSSLMSRQEIISAPIKMKVGTTEIESQKSAKNKMKELLKRARIAKGKKNYTTSIEYLHDAAMIASSWELSNDFLKIEEYTRIIKIEDLTIIKKEAEQTAKLAVKKKNYAEAAETYKKASKIASEIFKLGATEMTKEVKRLTNKANEYEKLK